MEAPAVVWGRLAAIAVAAVLVALLAHRLLRPVVLRLGRYAGLLDSVLRAVDRPVQAVLPLAALLVVWQGAPDDIPGIGAVEHTTGVLAILAITWLCVMPAVSVMATPLTVNVSSLCRALVWTAPAVTRAKPWSARPTIS